MKLLVVLALAGLAVAEPEAEADPALLYGQYGYGVHPAGYGYRYGPYSTYGAYNPYHYRAYSHYYGNFYGKREAGAEPEADPQILLNGFQPTFPIAGQTFVQQAHPSVRTVLQQAAPLTTVQLQSAPLVGAQAVPAQVVQVNTVPEANLQTPLVYNNGQVIPQAYLTAVNGQLLQTPLAPVPTQATFVQAGNNCFNEMGFVVPCLA